MFPCTGRGKCGNHPETSILVKMVPFWWHINEITPKRVLGVKKQTTARLFALRLKSIRGVAKSEGVFRDAARKVVKRHKNHFFDDFAWKCWSFHKIQFLRHGKLKFRKMHETIWIPIPNLLEFHLNLPKSPFVPKTHFFAQRRLWREKCALARKGGFGALFRTLPPRAPRKPIRAYVLSFKR